MSEIFIKTVERLPEILVKNASGMMQRMVTAMQLAVAADAGLENAAYCGLVLKMSADGLAHEFERAVTESMVAIKRDSGKAQFSASGFSLAIEPLDAAASSAEADFRSSSAVFTQLRAKADSLGAHNLAMFNKDVLLACVNEAFAKSRVGATEAAKTLPHARRALNDELLKLYHRLHAL
jgi:hypothetical protein